MISVEDGKGQFIGKRIELLGDFACIVDSFIDYFGVIELQCVLRIVGESRGVDLFEKKRN